LIKSGKMADMTPQDAQKNYKKAIEKGVLKILSKMGISLLSCYHGAQIFEIYGLGEEVVDMAFRGSVSRIGGLSIDDLQREAESFWVKVSFFPQVEKVIRFEEQPSIKAESLWVKFSLLPENNALFLPHPTGCPWGPAALLSALLACLLIGNPIWPLVKL